MNSPSGIPYTNSQTRAQAVRDIKDLGVSGLTGLVKTGGFVGATLNPMISYEDMENKINYYRDKVQSEELVNQRNKIADYYAKNGFNKEFYNLLVSNPKVGVNYLGEIGLPVNISTKLAQKGIMYAGGSIGQSFKYAPALAYIANKINPTERAVQIYNDVKRD